MRRIHTAIAACLGAVAVAMIMGMSPEGRAMGEGQSAIDWRSFNEAITQAPPAGKLVLLDVYTDWCGWCKRMDRDVYGDASVASYVGERYVAAKMNPEKEGKVTFKGQEYSQAEFAEALGISGYPATVFFGADGEIITVVPGYLPAKDFHLLLQFLADGHYKTQSWDEFQKNGAAQPTTEPGTTSEPGSAR